MLLMSIRLFQTKSWKILDRVNPAQDFPSDFDILSFDDNISSSISALEDHPAIKRVTAQRMVQRKIKYTLNDETFMYENKKNPFEMEEPYPINETREFLDENEYYDLYDNDDDDCEFSTCVFHSWRNVHRGRTIRSYSNPSDQVNTLFLSLCVMNF